MFCQKTKAHKQMRLAAAHGLLEMEHGLTGHACEASNAFRDQILHALGDVCLLEEGLSFAFDVN